MMCHTEIDIIKSRIEEKHQGDEKQLEIIFLLTNDYWLKLPLATAKHIQW